MYNELFSIGPLTIYGYGLMIGIGVIVALFWSTKRGAGRGINEDTAMSILLIAVVVGFAGAKVLYVITDWRYFLRDPLGALGSEGFVVYGGIITGLLGCWLYCRRKKVDFLEALDVFMPPVAAAQGFGRIGCFLAGCCYGKVTDSVFGVIFPSGGAPAVPVWPTQLFSSAGDFLLALALVLYDRRPHARGNTGAMYLILYGVGRFLIEFLRDDPRGSVGFFSTSQFISLFMVPLGVGLYMLNNKRAKRAAAAQEVQEDGE
ncbi:MAG: prolipoprotein diacylglyceryl transferase [Oscillospiraceae bacterium]|nr:prolipoprotein diacylglyceryl transferase [Oscillospiraceae bacterium]